MKITVPIAAQTAFSRAAPSVLAIAIVVFSLLGVVSHSHADEKMNLREVMAEARKSTQARTSIMRAKGAEAAASLERRSALLPTVSLAGSANLRDREFSLATPMGDFPIGDRFFANARLRISQPILDPTRLFYTSVAAKEEARAARHLSVRHEHELAMSAANIYLDVLTIDALVTANTAFTSNLDSRLKEVKAMVATNRAILSDQLQVELALENAQLQTLVLKERRTLATRSLGRAIGRDTAVEPSDVAYEEFMPGGESAHSKSELSHRSDLLALRSKRKAVKRRLAGVRSELLPQIVANGDLIYSGQGPQAETTFLQGSINLVWVPFAGGTRAARKDMYQAEISSLTLEYENAIRGAQLQVRQSQSAMKIAAGQLKVAATAILQSTEVVRITRERYSGGREKITDVLSAEAVLRDSIAKHKIAQLEGIRAQLLFRLAKEVPYGR